VIGLLRFLGILNAAVWFGATVFLALVAHPAFSSLELQNLLGPKNFSFFSTAALHILLARAAFLQLVCGMVAVLHLTAEWLYLGKVPHRHRRSALLVLIFLSVVNGFWLLPRLRDLNQVRHASSVSVVQRQEAEQSFRTVNRVWSGIDFFLLAGLGVYLWAVSASDSTRLGNSLKFRS